MVLPTKSIIFFTGIVDKPTVLSEKQSVALHSTSLAF